MRRRYRAVLAGAYRRARAGALRLLGRPLAAAVERFVRLSHRQVGVALVYHRVGDPPGERRNELVPALGASLFARQLRHLKTRYRLVAASELLATTRARRKGERLPVAITFDDDLRSHLDVAAPMLQSAGAAATFFLTGASLHAPHAFWWERLQAAFDRNLDVVSLVSRSGSPSTSIHELGREIERLPPGQRNEIDAALAALVGGDPLDAGLQIGDVELLAAFGFEIGFHTRRHDLLPSLEPKPLERAMREGRDELEKPVGRRLTSIAYPHGRADARVARAARLAEFDVGFTGTPEAVSPGVDSLLVGRLSPSYESVGELAFDVAWTLLRGPKER